MIQEELLRELGDKSELSDWFTREDSPVLQAVLPERPNPRNTQNQTKITELEEQIKRLVHDIWSEDFADNSIQVTTGEGSA